MMLLFHLIASFFAMRSLVLMQEVMALRMLLWFALPLVVKIMAWALIQYKDVVLPA